MSGIEKANGHKPTGLAHVVDPTFASATRPDADSLPFDLDAATAAVVALQAQAPEDAFSASYLGTERDGSGVVVGDGELVMTIGYLIAEAESVTLTVEGERTIPAQVVAYDHQTGFGLVRAAAPLGVGALEFGSSAAVAVADTLIVAARGGRDQAINGAVVSKREFAGYWEYMLDEAIFTTPPHPHWSGAALLDGAGKLVGIGYLFVQDALPDGEQSPGNMFLPIDAIKSVFDDVIKLGCNPNPPRPWLGLYSMEALDRVLVTSTSRNGPAERAGIEAGDVVLAVDGNRVTGLADMYRKLWGTGPAGVTVEFSLLRDNDIVHISVETIDRTKLMKLPRAH